MAGSSFTGPLRIKKSDGTKVTFVDADGNLVAGTAIIVDDGDSIDDGNGNEVLEFGVVAAAVNHLKITNAATGNPAILSALGDDNTVALQLEAKDATVATADGGAINILPGDGNTTGTGGDVVMTAGAGGATGGGGSFTLTTGAGGATSGDAGDFTITGGTPVEGTGGNITITASSGVGTDQDAGSVVLQAGNATGTGTPGSVALTAGDGNDSLLSQGGGITLTAGAGLNTTNAAGGPILITAGGGDGTGAGGSWDALSGDGEAATGAGTGGDSGALTLSSGQAGGGDTGAGGAAGAVGLLGGFGGDTTGVGGTGGIGADVTLMAGSGGSDIEGSAGTGGAGGNVIIQAGVGGTGNTAGADGTIDLASPHLTSSTQALTDTGATDIINSITEYTTTGAATSTLADGTEGQHKFLVMVVDAGDQVLTPTNLLGFTTITFNDAGDGCHLLFTGGNWIVVGNQGCTLA